MYTTLSKINNKPLPFATYSSRKLWTDEHASRKMLEFHLNENIDVSSRKAEFIQRSLAWIASHFKLGMGTRVADFGCGPGLYTTALAKTGAKVTGIDFSRNSINYARNAARLAGLDIRYVTQNYLTWQSPGKFDLILMIMCDYCALSPEQRTGLLTKFRATLNPGGSILLDVFSLNAFTQRQETAVYEHNLLDGFWSAADYYGFLNVFKYEAEKVVLDKYTVFEPGRKFTVHNWLQYFNPESLATEFIQNGLNIGEYYADVAGTAFNPESGEFAIVARHI